MQNPLDRLDPLVIPVSPAKPRDPGKKENYVKRSPPSLPAGIKIGKDGKWTFDPTGTKTPPAKLGMQGRHSQVEKEKEMYQTTFSNPLLPPSDIEKLHAEFLRKKFSQEKVKKAKMIFFGTISDLYIGDYFRARSDRNWFLVESRKNKTYFHGEGVLCPIKGNSEDLWFFSSSDPRLFEIHRGETDFPRDGS